MVYGLREKLWSSGAIQVMLNYARTGEFSVHRLINTTDIDIVKKIGEGTPILSLSLSRSLSLFSTLPCTRAHTVV
mgnify:FL=1